ncbi:MAG: Crp/Fnr family transcriptional regulator [Pyrinomonadaceae bacterium]|nr:Crp/Fnr family transcriptional regulator [Pyrinomonadaceae bacterium]
MTADYDTRTEPIENVLLAALPDTEFKRIFPSLELIDLELDEALWEMEEKRKYIYFPTSAMICLLYETEEGVSIEVGMTGRKGMVGVVTFVGDARMAKRAVVQRAGQAYRMKAADVEKHFESSPAFHDICMSYTQTLIAQISQSAICNRLHSLEQQICRYLLVNQDNLQTKTFHMTHAQMASVLGVRRESVSIAARQLKERGVIDYSRGKIMILSKRDLLNAACECYLVVKDQYDRILNKYVSGHKD